MGGTFRAKRALLAGVLLGSYPALLTAALWPLPWLFAAVVPLSYAAEVALPRKTAERLGRAHLGVTLRFMMRETAAVLLVARIAGAESRWLVLLAGGMFAFHGVRAVQTALADLLNRCHNLMPVTTRNLDLSTLRIPPAPPERLLNWRGARLLYLDALPVGLTAFGALTAGRPGAPGGPAGAIGAAGVAGAAGAVAAIAAVAVELAAVAALLVHVRRAAHLRNRGRIIRAVDEQVRAYQPDVLLYFSGPPKSAYQATMWLDPLERIGCRALVVLRERELANALGRTTLPVLCIPSAVDLMNFRGLDSARVALFASNVGNNIHMLRVPGVTSVFIGHGDSDKEASFNPFTKVYDEVWVAGPAGRERYRRAQVGVRDEAIVEVGRPQLSEVLRSSPFTQGVVPYRTVLYAPTWEGWTDDLFHTSIVTMGPALVRALLGQPVRLIYKPHPLTGHRSPAARAAHRRILALLSEPRTAGSEARTAGSGVPAVPNLAVTGAGPSLYDCFNQADLLIGDISSVVTDFVASGKPYAVTNVAGRPEPEFRHRYPTAGAAYLLSDDLRELPGVLGHLQTAGEDPMAGARRELRAHLLGPDHPDALTRFDEAVKRACAAASLNSRIEVAGAETIALSARE
ncbi:CDP-glycerol glycerophosphotransferase family protein [Planotetraspora sp. GP83]|uniref:CDP-glycerol glycerophosphotransferase family protein n=1 Tax=Planotetraspora sp. GP83 TaxID=3156264 RepID=UPI0035153A26